jgi:methionine synthase II (cobalamin-independent)
MKPLAFPTTLIGSFPYPGAQPLCERILASASIPAWPQLPRRNFRESMYVQYSPQLPGIVIDPAAEKVYFDTSGDLSAALERFYERYLADDVDAFALEPAFAEGFFVMLDALRAGKGAWAKGHVTGPVSFGLTVTDQNLRSSLYDETLADAIIKNMAMHARWQVRQLKTVRSGVIIFVDEPYMASFGSAFIAISREQVIAALNEVFEAIHAEGGMAGVHCCGNTDWSVLMDTTVDILNLDALEYLENLSLYPGEVRRFVDRGGQVAWGALPNDRAALDAQPEAIAARLVDGLRLLARRAESQGIELPVQAWASASLLTPACGMGSTSPEVADRVLELLAPTRQAVLAAMQAV